MNILKTNYNSKRTTDHLHMRMTDRRGKERLKSTWESRQEISRCIEMEKVEFQPTFKFRIITIFFFPKKKKKKRGR